jgi:hypothetical protein
MWSVEAPRVTVADAAAACSRGVRDKALARRVIDAIDVMNANTVAYQAAIVRHQLHTVTASGYKVAILTDAELKGLYTKQMAKPGRPGRHIYNELRGGARHGLCSYCQYGQAMTLDHFVPKSSVAALSIDPWNLIPCCRDCNSELMESYPTDPEKQLLHPYEMPEMGRWLYAQVVREVPVSVKFRADPDPDLDEQLQARVINQFDELALGRMYSVVAGREISETNHTLSRLFTAGDADLIRHHLSGLAKDAFASQENTRRGALYEALAADTWYCTTGFLT